MNRVLTPHFLLYVTFLLTPLPGVAAEISTVLISNPGNAPDQSYAGQGPFGSVAYNYRIGKYEVTNNQYAEFLNAKAATDPFELYSPFMATNEVGGITRSGVSGSFTYAVKPNRGENPVVYVSWYDSIRFANWLHNGQGSGSTETGAYTLLGGTETPSNSLSITRTPSATWFLPSENEWYKAAYYQPSIQGGDADSYWLYPTRTNSTPYSDQPPGSGAPTQSNTANFYANDVIVNGYDDGYAVTGTHVLSSFNYLTNVGAYTQSGGFYGTFDQGGNAFEWTEGRISGGGILRGGTWFDTAQQLSASVRRNYGAANDTGINGFRVATVPEPSGMVLLVLGGVALSVVRLRLRVRPYGEASKSTATASSTSTRRRCSRKQ